MSLWFKLYFIFFEKIKYSGFVIDKKNKTITIPEDYKIIFLGNMEVESKKNVNINSNYKNVDSKTNKPYTINLNCE